MLTTAILKGISLGLLLSISIGPVIFSIIKQSLNNGHKAGYAFVAGVSFSDITLVFLSNLFTEFFSSLLNHKELIGYVGGLFLLIIGIYSVFFKQVNVAANDDLDIVILKKKKFTPIFLSGFFMNILNPAVFIFWLFWSTAVTADSLVQTNPTQYKIIVFSTCLIFVLISDILKVELAGKLRKRITPKLMHRINQISGLFFLVFGLILLYSTYRYNGNISH